MNDTKEYTEAEAITAISEMARAVNASALNTTFSKSVQRRETCAINTVAMFLIGRQLTKEELDQIW